ncbi:Response regulator [Variovorax sp. HW608]|uniref:response regulator n=1 Tax=Variovorax sp. HW608 TaxID=1034889 RepID=UPI00081FD1A2|nr:response regulator [Variovorax sp. HW608]SCK21499.1 Response regulator [Variovorax sp. HW608]
MKTRRGPLRIVYVVDRDESVREGLGRLIDSADFEAQPCASVQEFLELAHWRQAACILLEVSALRDCDAAVRAALRSLADVLPVIALSASDNTADSDLARALGARSFFRKPVDAAALFDAIEWAVHNGNRARHS